MTKHEQLHAVIAENIRQRRQAMGLSQEALADNCGVHRTYIGSLERGERNLTVNTLAKVADALGCTAIDLLIPSKTGSKKS